MRFIEMSIRELSHMLAATSKPWRLKALDCVGFHEVEDNQRVQRVAFAFNVPDGMQPQPTTLRQLIESRKRPEDRGIYIGDRFTLAQGLASAYYQLLYLGWLHKGIRNENVQFYRSTSEAEDDWQPDPKKFYLMGYEFSRPISSASLSVKPEETEDSARYRHPRYLDSVRAQYEPAFDMYSLGIVLSEIALWKTAKTLAVSWNRDKRRRPHVSLEEWQTIVDTELVGEVERKVGRVYAEVVRRCIKGDLGTDCALNNLSEMLRCFDKRIVANLEKCFA